MKLSTLSEMARMALSYLRGRKLRTALTTLAVVFGVAVIFSVNLVLPSAMSAFKAMVSGTSGTVDLTISNITGESFAPDKPLQAVSGIQGIQAVTGVLRRQISLPSLTSAAIGKAAQLDLIGVDPATVQVVHHYVTSQGRFLQADDTGKAIVPAGIAELAPQLKVGTTFPLITAGGLRLYTIVGYLAGSGDLSTPQIIVSLADAQKAFNQPGLINTIEANVTPGADIAAVSAAVQQALGPQFTVGGDTNPTGAFASLQIAYAIFDLIGLLSLFIGAFLIYNTFRTVVLERRHDLAVLRTIGATRQQLVQLILVESLLQGVIGTLVGLVFGFLLAAIGAAFFASVAPQFMPGLRVDVQLTASAFVGPVLLGVLVTLAAGYFPARAASRTSPLEALRPVSTADVKRAARWSLIGGLATMAVSVVLLLASKQTAASGALLFLIGMVVASPALVMPVARLFSPILELLFRSEGDLARNNMTRQPGRAAITASTLMIGLATLILFVALIDSLTVFVEQLVNKNFISDVLLLPQSVGIYGSDIGADDGLTAKLQALPQVQTVAGLRYASSAVNSATIQVLGIDPVAYPQVSPMIFNEGTPQDAYAALSAGRNAIVNAILAATIKAHVGSDVVLKTVDGTQSYHVVGIANDVLSMKLNTVIVSQANLQTDFHKAEDVMLMVNLKPGADRQAALQAIQAAAADYPQFNVKLTGDYRSTLIDLTVGVTKSFYALVLLILIPASFGLLNTLTINVLERTREIGMVRATGGSRRQVRRIVMAEALLLGLFGAAIGCIVGIAISYGFIAAFAAFGWEMPYSFPVAGLVVAVVAAVILALVASVIPARNAARLDIIRALQYE